MPGTYDSHLAVRKRDSPNSPRAITPAKPSRRVAGEAAGTLVTTFGGSGGAGVMLTSNAKSNGSVPHATVVHCDGSAPLFMNTWLPAEYAAKSGKEPHSHAEDVT